MQRNDRVKLKPENVRDVWGVHTTYPGQIIGTVTHLNGDVTQTRRFRGDDDEVWVLFDDGKESWADIVWLELLN